MTWVGGKIKISNKMGFGGLKIRIVIHLPVYRYDPSETEASIQEISDSWANVCK
jgi:SPX domain protein involved in polyphosphate accumulation